MPDAKIAVITGAASGLGAACTQLLLDTGWQVHGWDRHAGADERVRWSALDITDEDSVRAAAAEVSHLDLLINAAGVRGESATIENMDLSDWRQVMNVNVTGTLIVCQSLWPSLREARGTIANLASTMSYRAMARRAHYNVSKAGIDMLTKVMALEGAADGIRVFAVSPGTTRTPLVADALAAGLEDVILARVPAGRIPEADEIAKAIVALCDSTFAYLTGSAVLLDGGFAAL